jgi:predicted GIY-YIG superfamily endonuclease
MTRLRQPATCMMASARNGALYVGVTSDLVRRAAQHRAGSLGGFTSSYGCKLLVWFELHESMAEAITREKKIKAGSRARKLALIESSNPTWRDLYEDIL